MPVPVEIQVYANPSADEAAVELRWRDPRVGAPAAELRLFDAKRGPVDRWVVRLPPDMGGLDDAVAQVRERAADTLAHRDLDLTAPAEALACTAAPGGAGASGGPAAVVAAWQGTCGPLKVELAVSPARKLNCPTDPSALTVRVDGRLWYVEHLRPHPCAMGYTLEAAYALGRMGIVVVRYAGGEEGDPGVFAIAGELK